MKVEFYTQRSGCFTRLMLLTIAVMVGARLLPGITVQSFGAVLLTALVISLLDNILRPVLIVITLPATVVTLGLFLFVINALIILLASEIVDGFHVDTISSAILFSLTLSVVNFLLELPNYFLNRQELKDAHFQSPGQSNDDDDDFTPYEEIKD